MASAAYDGTNGGTGGKIRRKPLRKTHTTPYDRPPTAIRQTPSIVNGGNNNNGWLSKIVDPASRFITAGAHKFFSSVFMKRLLPPPPPSPPQQSPSSPPAMDVDEGKKLEYVQLETATNVGVSDTKVPLGCGGVDSVPSDSNGVAELEDILKQKTFSRSEIDHLTALLLSRTTENSNAVEKEMSEANRSDLQVIHARRDRLANVPALETKIERPQFADFSTPEVRSKVLPDDVASPAEIAKLYMGSRSTKGSPSLLRLQNQLPKDDFSTHCIPFSKPSLPVMSLTQKPVSDAGTSSKVLVTPRFRGRSAIYSMSRTPYSRGHPVTNFKAVEAKSNSGGGASYLDRTENNLSNKQVLKRRSSVLESDIGSVGPIRRIRQKPNLLHPKTLSLPSPGSRQATHVSGVFSDVTEAPSMERSYPNRSLSKAPAENGYPGSSSSYVPKQSIETAQRIFEHLDKFSPRKDLGKNVVPSVGKSPMKTADMESHDSLKLLQSNHDTKKFMSSNSVHAPNHQVQASSNVEEINAKSIVTASASTGPQGGLEAKKGDPYPASKSKIAECMTPVSAVDPPLKQRSFQMSAHEDFLDMDDDSPPPEVTLSTPSTQGKLQAKSSTQLPAVSGIFQQDQATQEKPLAMNATTQPRKTEQESRANGSSDSKTTATFPFSPASNITVADTICAPQPILKFDGVGQQNEISNIFKSSKSDNLPASVCSSQPAAKDSNLESLVSANEVKAEVKTPDKSDNKSTPLFGNSFIKSGDAPPFSAFFNGSQPNNANTVNGAVSTIPAKVDASGPNPFTSSSSNPSPAPVSMSPPSSSATFKFSNGGIQPTVTPSTSAPLTSSTSANSGSTTASLFTFASGFSSPSVTSSTAPSITSEKLGANSSASGLGNTAGNPSAFAFTSPTFASTGGSDVQSAGTTGNNKASFSFQASGASVSALSPSSSVSDPASTSALSFPGQSASSALAPASTSALSFSGQSAMSPSPFVFGSGGSTGSSSASIFGSVPATPFSAGSGSAPSALGSSFTSSPLPTSSSTTSIFGVSSQSPKPTPTIAPPQSSVFSFGLGSSGASSSTTVFGSSAPLFGATSSSSASISSTPVFGTSTSSSATNSSPFTFGGNSGLAASTPAMTNSPFQSASTPAMTSSPFQQSQPTFGNSNSQPFMFGGSSPAANTDQMTMEDTMAEDSSQPSTPPAPAFGATLAFGAAPSAPSGGFAFNATPPAPAAASPFQFNTQPSQIAAPNPFQPSGSLEFNGGTNSFSLGTSDKSQRRIVKVKKGPRRKN